MDLHPHRATTPNASIPLTQSPTAATADDIKDRPTYDGGNQTPSHVNYITPAQMDLLANRVGSLLSPRETIPSKVVPPLNFAMVAQGVYRSGYPNKKNFPFLKNLKLKTIMYVCSDDMGEENLNFIAENNIQLFQYNVKGNKEPFQEIDQDDIAKALVQVLDIRNHPILIHCNKGKHRIGCLVGCLRKLQGWSLTSIFDEYQRFSGAKLRIPDLERPPELCENKLFVAEIEYHNNFPAQILRTRSTHKTTKTKAGMMATAASRPMAPSSVTASSMSMSAVDGRMPNQFAQIDSVISDYNSLKDDCDGFIKKFNGWLAAKKDSIKAGQSQHDQQMLKNQAKLAEMKRDIESVKSKILEINKHVENEKSQEMQAEKMVADLAEKKADKERLKSTMAAEVELLSREVAMRKEGLRRRIEQREAHASKNYPEMIFYEQKLAFKITSLKHGILKVSFTHINEKNWDQEFGFIVDVSVDGKYEVTDCVPLLPNLSDLTVFLNETRDFYRFLKEMRKGFVEHSRRERKVP
ncbi:hypothetical protein HDU76_007365, partial [Blyttiomyces sp. JEL0837]